MSASRAKLNTLINQVALELSKEKAVRDRIRESGYPAGTATFLANKVSDMKAASENKKVYISEFADASKMDKQKCEDRDSVFNVQRAYDICSSLIRIWQQQLVRCCKLLGPLVLYSIFGSYVCVSVYACVCVKLFVCLSVSVYVYICLSVCLSVCVSF